MSNKSAPSVAVIGAGVIGTLTAYILKKNKFDVSLFDENLPGTQTSMGNAGTFAHYASLPINNEDNFKKLPFFLFSDRSPLSIQWKNLLFIYPWLFKFLQNSSKDKVKEIISQLTFILQKAYISNNNLFHDINFGNLISDKETLYLYENEKDYSNDEKNINLRESNNINFHFLSPDQIKDLEPNLKKSFYKGILFEESKFTINPLKFVQKIFNEYQRMKGVFTKRNIIKIENEDNLLLLKDNHKKFHKFNKIIICAGSFSNNLSNLVGENFPMVSERGYHLMYKNYKNLISRPISIVSQGSYYIPMEEGLRVAGTVEIGGNDKLINKKRTSWMHQNTINNFNIHENPDKIWLGYRPTLPDSLPIIGKSKKNPNIIYNFGHQHLGLTLGAFSAELVLKIISNIEINSKLKNLNSNRFN